jgi:hypothetical protein
MNPARHLQNPAGGTRAVQSWRQFFLMALLMIAMTMVLGGCFNQNDSDSGQSEEGIVDIGLTDAEGDFFTYTVDVTSLTLTKANGAQVNTLPVNTSVDFSQYTEMTEFLTAATVPSGVYTHANMVLDYTNADIQVENANGDAVPVETILDEEGNPIDSLTVSVRLDDLNRLTIAPGVPAHLTLDFDLSVSNNVSFDESGNPILTVKPILQAEVNPQAPKIHRVRGALRSVDVNDSQFRVIIRPFVHAISGADERFGTLTVSTTETTSFEIDGVPYVGQDGLAQLDAMPALSAVVSIGDLKFNPVRFEAREVYAGSSVPGGTADAVRGNVIKREGDVVTIKGATLIRAGGSVVFNDEVQVQLADTTVVRRQHSQDEFNIDDISVGQAVIVFGALTSDTAGQLELDASNGLVRMQFTTLRGTVIGTTSVPEIQSPFVVDLQAIDGRRASLFDFAGTGTTAEDDADSDNYEIDAGTLDTSKYEDGAPVKARGFVRAFGQAPADFDAQTIVDVTAVKALMTVGWSVPTADAFVDLSEQGMTLNLEGVGKFHYVGRAGVVVDLTQTDSAPVIAPQESGEGLFYVKEGTTVQLYTTFASFVEGLQTRLADGKAVKSIVAIGDYDDSQVTLTARRIQVLIR